MLGPKGHRGTLPKAPSKPKPMSGALNKRAVLEVG